MVTRNIIRAMEGVGPPFYLHLLSILSVDLPTQVFFIYELIRPLLDTIGVPFDAFIKPYTLGSLEG